VRLIRLLKFGANVCGVSRYNAVCVETMLIGQAPKKVALLPLKSSRDTATSSPDIVKCSYDAVTCSPDAQGIMFSMSNTLSKLFAGLYSQAFWNESFACCTVYHHRVVSWGHPVCFQPRFLPHDHAVWIQYVKVREKPDIMINSFKYALDFASAKCLLWKRTVILLCMQLCFLRHEIQI